MSTFFKQTKEANQPGSLRQPASADSDYEKNSQIIMAFESSCDETAISIIKVTGEKLEILANEISSQVKLHAKWGGVVPNLAAREHVKNISPLFDLALQNAAVKISDIDLIAVTQGPGLIPALMVATGFAKTLAYFYAKPLIGIHHIEGHIYANFVGISKSQFPISKQIQKTNLLKIKREYPSIIENCELKIENSLNIKFPILCLVVSGGHTQLVLMKDHLKYEIIGQTLDDAVGEAFDKVARILSIGYPGGPNVAAWAAKFQISNFKFQISLPRPMLHKKNFDFSFSGLKTAVLYETKKHPELLKDGQYIGEVCHEFQQAAIDVLIAKTIKAAQQYEPRTIMLAGGVSANKELRKQLGEAISKFLPTTEYKIPDTSLTGDNAAMIGAAAAFRWQKMSDSQRKKACQAWSNLQPDANLKLK